MTEQKIQKLNDLKKATMNELLTKGIDHSEFRDTELGRIPVGWNLQKLGDLVENISDGGTPSSGNPAYYHGSIPWVVIDDIKPEIYTTKTSLSRLGLQKSSAKMWNPETIILSTGATIGRVGIAKVSLSTKQGICGIVPKSNINNKYLYYFLLSSSHLLNHLSQGSTIKETRPPTLKNIIVPVPPIDEQIQISKILTSIDDSILANVEKEQKLQNLKKGLMEDLLTGKVRVKVDD